MTSAFSLTDGAGELSRKGSPPDLARLLSGTRLPALDGLRAVSVFLVILSHSVINLLGDVAVSAFFVLSGFLITWLLCKELRATGDISLRQFYWRRTLRIFPAYYVFLLFSISVDLLRGDSRIKPMIAPALLYLVNYYNAWHGHPDSSVTHAWSLAVEEQFYLLWPLGLLVLARMGRRAIVLGLLGAITLVVAWRCVAYYRLGLGTAYVYNAFDTRFDNLAVGCLLAVLAERSWFIAWARRAAFSPLLPLVTLAALLFSRFVSEAYHYGPGFTVDALLIAIFIVQMLQLYQSWMWRWLEHPVTRYLGTISYPLYLYHGWGLGVGRLAHGLSSGGQIVLGVLGSIVLASASYFFVEKPFLRLKRRLETRPVRAEEIQLAS